MPIPDFQSMMLPLLKFAADGEEHSTSEAMNHLVKYFNITEEERNELLPSGKQKIFVTRASWAKTDLKYAKLIETTKYGHFKITPAGLEVLNKKLDKINIAFLKTIPSFKEKAYPAKKKIDIKETEDEDEIEILSDLDPVENIENIYQDIKLQLIEDILLKIKEMSPKFFENLVVELLVKMGYGGSIKDAGQAVGKAGDEGIDGIIKEDKLGLDMIYIQAKRWEGVVGSPEIYKFLGALNGKGARKGVFITTSHFTKDALNVDPKGDTKIILINGEQLAQYMIEYGLGVTTVSTYEIKRIDLDYFGEE